MAGARWEVWIDGWRSPVLRSSRPAAMNAAAGWPRAHHRVVRHAGTGERWELRGGSWWRNDEPHAEVAPVAVGTSGLDRSLPPGDRE